MIAWWYCSWNTLPRRVRNFSGPYRTCSKSSMRTHVGKVTRILLLLLQPIVGKIWSRHFTADRSRSRYRNGTARFGPACHCQGLFRTRFAQGSSDVCQSALLTRQCWLPVWAGWFMIQRSVHPPFETPLAFWRGWLPCCAGWSNKH